MARDPVHRPIALQVLNNWTVITEGFVAVTSSVARIFFAAFYVAGVLICLNLLVAFAIDAFMTIVDERKGWVAAEGSSTTEFAIVIHTR